jgi:hypothetical protein
MLEWYVLALICFSLAFDQHRTMLTSQTYFPSVKSIHALCDLSAWLGGTATLLILIMGFFIGAWWWPFLAMIFGTAVNYCGRLVIPMKYRWITSIASTPAGFSAITIFLN